MQIIAHGCVLSFYEKQQRRIGPQADPALIVYALLRSGNDMFFILEDVARGDDAAHAGGGVHAGVGAQHGAGVQHAVAAHFHEIAHHGPELPAARGDLLRAVLHHHQGFVALYVGGNGARAHVALVAHDGIAHIVEMGHLHAVEEDGVFDF